MYPPLLIFLSYLFSFWRYLLALVSAKKRIPPPQADPVAEFVEQQSQAIQRRCKNKQVANQNVDMVFYSKKAYQQLLVDEKNREEQLWKTRFLFTATPRGNIIMFYDVYKLGFAYYSDTQSIPYSVLNAVAMKYVSQFHCLDFFMDDRVFPEFHVSPLLSILLTEEKKPATENKEEKNVKLMLNHAPFAKLKNYSKSTAPTRMDASGGGMEDVPAKEFTSNRFICLGKIANFQILQRGPSKKTAEKKYASKLFDDFRRIHPVESAIDDMVRGHSEEKNEMNYRAYKELRNRTVFLQA
jgi:hypothetical protein